MTDAPAPAPDADIFRWRVTDDNGVETVYEVDLLDITGIEWRRMKEVAGLTQVALLRGISTEFDCVAAFVWMLRSREEPKVKYLDVLAPMSYRNTAFINSDDDDAAAATTDEGEAGPPA